jgi:hypothetical protein
MTTPLQVTIMSLLLERRVRAPQDRYALFDGYYSAIYEREVNKKTPVGLLLDTQRSHIHALHEHVSVLLQARAEHAGDADALLPEDELHRLALTRLAREEFPAAEAQQLASRLVTAATDRLVLLVGRTAGTIGFEIRSLQEFMAARAIVHGPDTDVLRRLRGLAPSAHWRNVWLFAAGRIFTHHEHLRDSLVTILADLDTADIVALLIKPGARLAADLLMGDVGYNSPRYRRLLAKHTSELLDFFPSEDLHRLDGALFPVANEDTVARRLVDTAVDRALAGPGRSVLTALALLTLWDKRTGPMAAGGRQKHARVTSARGPELADWSAVVRPDPRGTGAMVIFRKPNLRGVFERYVGQQDISPDVKDALDRKLSPGHVWPESDGEAEAWALIADSLPMQEWQSAEILARVLVQWHGSLPAAEYVAELTDVRAGTEI